MYCISSIKVGPQLYMSDGCCIHHSSFTTHSPTTGGSSYVPATHPYHSWIFMVFSEHLDGMSIQMAGLDHDVLRIHIGGMIPATSFDLDTYSYGCFICPAANCAQNH